MDIAELIKHLGSPPCERCGRRAANNSRFTTAVGRVYDALCTSCKLTITLTPACKRRLQAELSLALGPMFKPAGKS
jgi:hypothetical protein